MDINITGRNIDLDDSMKRYIHKRFDKIEKLYRRIYKCEVILEEEKERKNVEVILSLKRNRIVAKESSPDLYASLDNAYENVKKQVRRMSGRVNSKKRKVMLGRIMSPVTFFKQQDEYDIPSEIGGITSVDSFSDKPMLPEEAKLEISLTKKDFIVFKNADTGEVNVLYRRSNGNFGLIEPKF